LKNLLLSSGKKFLNATLSVWTTTLWDLGGDSLLGARIVALVNNAFSPKTPLANIFQAPTVADLIRYVRANEAEPGQAEKIAAIWLQVTEMSNLEVAQALRQRKDYRSEV
jgi:acyl carrier protein